MTKIHIFLKPGISYGLAYIASTEKVVSAHVKRVLVNCRTEMGRRGRATERSAAPWQAEITPMGCQPCPWDPCGLIKETILSQEGPASLFFLLSDIWSFSTAQSICGAALWAWPGNSSGSEVILLYPGAGTPQPAHLLKEVWNAHRLDLRVCVVFLSQIIPEI